MPRENFYSTHSCLFYLSGQVLLLPFSGFGPLAHNLLGIVTEKANTCPCPSLVESGMDFLGGQAMLRGSLWIIFIILVIGMSTGKPTTFGYVLKEKGGIPRF